MIPFRETGAPCTRCGAARSCEHSAVEPPVAPPSRLTTSSHHKGERTMGKGARTMNGRKLDRINISGGGVYSKTKRTKYTDEGKHSGTKFHFGS